MLPEAIGTAALKLAVELQWRASTTREIGFRGVVRPHCMHPHASCPAWFRFACVVYVYLRLCLCVVCMCACACGRLHHLPAARHGAPALQLGSWSVVDGGRRRPHREVLLFTVASACALRQRQELREAAMSGCAPTNSTKGNMSSGTQ